MDQTGESEGVRSRLYRGCSNISKFSFLKFSTVWQCLHQQWMWTGVRFLPHVCASIFEPLAPLTDNPLWHDTAPIMHWHYSTYFDIWYTFSPQKWINALCSSLVQIKLGMSMTMAKTYERNGLLRSRLHHNGRRGVDHVYFVMPNQQLQNMYLSADNFWLTYV